MSLRGEMYFSVSGNYFAVIKLILPWVKRHCRDSCGVRYFFCFLVSIVHLVFCSNYQNLLTF